jgi:hypothetical protein
MATSFFTELYGYGFIFWILFIPVLDIAAFSIFTALTSKAKSSEHVQSLIFAMSLIFLSSAANVGAWNEANTHPYLLDTARDIFKNHYSDVAIDDVARFKGASLPLQSDLQLSCPAWIRIGTIDEDAWLNPPTGTARFLRHFYNPLNGSGLLHTYASSLEWATTHSGNDHRYSIARDRYIQALQTTGSTQRNEHFGECYYRIGMLSHLIQDLTAAEHVRNDPHPIDNFYEVYAATQDVADVLSRAGSYGINVADPILVQNFTDYWTSSGPDGIAGLVNRNFFSPDTIRPFGDSDYPRPCYPNDINENPTSLNSLTYTSYQLPGGGGPILGAYLTHRNQYLGAAPMKLCRAGYYTFDVTPDPNAVPGTVPSYQIHAWNASWMLTHDVLDDCLTVQWPLAVRASAGVLHHFFPGWTIAATASLQGDTLRVSGTIRHNREPGTFRWWDIAALRSSRVTLTGRGIRRPITLYLDVNAGAFEKTISLRRLRAQYHLSRSARPETVVLVFDIGAERYTDTFSIVTVDT